MRSKYYIILYIHNYTVKRTELMPKLNKNNHRLKNFHLNLIKVNLIKLR